MVLDDMIANRIHYHLTTQLSLIKKKFDLIF